MGKKIDYSATEKAQLTSEGKDSDLSRLQANGARALPSSPSASGWSADAIKRQLYRPAELLFAWLVKLARAQLDLAQKADDALDGETARLDQNVASLSSLISTKEQSLLAKITQEATTRGNADAALSARIDEAKANGYAKFDDLGNVIKDTYVKRTQIVNNVTSEGETEKPLGAGQGYVLQNQIDHILTLLASDDSTLDTLQEVVAYIKSNKSLIDAITTTKVSVSDIIDNLTSEIANKPLSAKQGKVLKGLIDALQTVVDTLATKSELEEVKDELDSASVDVLDYSMGKVSGKDDGLALPEESQLELKSLRGNTVAWNQLFDKDDVGAYDGANVTISQSGSPIIGTVNIAGSGTYDYGIRSRKSFDVVKNHKYLLLFSAYSNANVTDCGFDSGSWMGISKTVPCSTNQQVNGSFIVNAETSISNRSLLIRFSGTYAVGDIIRIDYAMGIDLTKLYGAGNEPTLTTDPKAQWAINYALKHPANDAGSLVSVDMSAYETIGFNQWDEEWEVGGYDLNGAPITYSTTIRSKNYIKVKPNTTYYFKTSGHRIYVCGYDANHNFIGYIPNSAGFVDWDFVVPPNCHYLRFQMSSTYGTTYNHDICINVSDSSLNGTYKPSEKNPYPISFHGKSAGSAYDERKADGTDIVGIGDVDLATRSWTYNATNHYWETPAPDGAKTHSYEDNYKPNLLSDKYQVATHGGVSSITNSVTLSTVLRVNNGSSETTPTGTLYYELETLVESVNDPLPNAIKVYQYGTEWQINDGAPCGMEKDYDVSIKGQVITNVRVDARQEEEIKELKETALTAENVEGVLLWENGNHFSTFAESDIVLSEAVTNYAEIEVEFKYYYQWTLTQTVRVKLRGYDITSSSNCFLLSAVNSEASEQGSRWVIMPAGEPNKLHCEHGYKASGSQDDSFCIPIAIYGIK